MIQFYDNAVAHDLGFLVTTTDTAGCDPVPADLTGATVRLVVLNNAGSPFMCAPTGNPGEVKHTVLAGEFPVPSGTKVFFWSAYLSYTKGAIVRLSDAFIIAVIKEPSVNL